MALHHRHHGRHGVLVHAKAEIASGGLCQIFAGIERQTLRRGIRAERPESDDSGGEHALFSGGAAVLGGSSEEDEERRTQHGHNVSLPQSLKSFMT